VTPATALLALAALLAPSPEPSGDPAEALRALTARPRLPDLRWADVSDQRTDLHRFYESRAFAPAWTRQGVPTAQARAVAGVLAGAAAKGLGAADYQGPDWPARIAALEDGAGAAETLARFDAALSVSVLRYAAAVSRGRVDPRALGHPRLADRAPLDLPALLEELAEAPDPAARLATVEPQTRYYRRLLETLAWYRALAARLGDLAPLGVPRHKVERGGIYADATRLAELLAALGDLEPGPGGPADEAPSHVYGPELATAVSRFQARHGLQPDGVLGRETAAALNVPLAGRVRQIELTLERMRWLPSAFPEPPIVVNIPEFRLLAFGGDPSGVVLSMPVIVGGDYAHRRTPVLARRMEQIVFSPYWDVPPRIAREELAESFRKRPGLAARERFFVQGPAGRQPVDAASMALVLAGKARLRQGPGPANALGHVKFVFPNEHGVYLHDTPTRRLFARSYRALSHGCIRVADPVALAAHLLRDQAGWTRERIAAAMAADEPVVVKLDRRPPVLLLYGTAYVPDDGAPHFFADIYGHDRRLERALARAYPR